MLTARLLRFGRRLTSADFWALQRGAQSSWTVWAESLMLPLISVALAWWAVPEDPMLAAGAFPWLWLAPILVALRYGVMPGLIASAVLLCNWLLGEQLGVIGANFSREYFFGGALAVLICGEFSDVWRDRLTRIDETNLYLTDRVSRLTKRHLLLNLSHDRMEQEMLARPGSLRDALAQVRDIAIKGEKGHALPGIDGLLQLLAQYTSIESAAVYQINRTGKTPTLGEVVGQIGNPPPLEADDGLLAIALNQGTLAHIADSEVSLERQSKQLVVAPLQASDNTLVGVLSVSQLPFFSLNVENLQMLSVILGYYADNVHTGEIVSRLIRRLPTMPIMYAQEMARMIGLQRKVGLSSQIVLMHFTHERGEEIRTQFLRIKRGLDVYWQTESQGFPAIAILMPFASSAACIGFIARLEGWLQAQFKGDVESLGIRLQTIDFAECDPLETLAKGLALGTAP